jgi:hypothetical protein
MGKHPKPMTFGRWLVSTGQLDATTLGELSKTFTGRNLFRNAVKGFHTEPMSFTAFIAKELPHEFVIYQTYLRLIGADTIKIKRD